jgi:4-diphosphocytidyl-2-C-methyl-D-erythritol kinase
VKQFAPAKINLYLHILGRRPDGFHELETLMAPISLGDTLEIELIPDGIEFTCSDPALADAKDNLATRAARVFLDEFKPRDSAAAAATRRRCCWRCAV